MESSREEKLEEPAFKKAKRCTWDETMENDEDIIEKDKSGHYVLCKYCKRTGRQDPLLIKSQDPFGTKAWKKHKASKTHLSLVGKHFPSVASFFERVGGTSKPAENEEPKSSGCINQASINSCTGIYNTNKGKEKHLSAMMNYGVFNDLNVIIQKKIQVAQRSMVGRI
jgi:hypothetical protein